MKCSSVKVKYACLFEGDVAKSVISIAIIGGVAVAILLRHSLKLLQGVIDVTFAQGDLDQARGNPGLLQEREQHRSQGLPAIKLPGKIAELLVTPEKRLRAG